MCLLKRTLLVFFLLSFGRSNHDIRLKASGLTEGTIPPPDTRGRRSPLTGGSAAVDRDPLPSSQTHHSGHMFSLVQFIYLFYPFSVFSCLCFRGQNVLNCFCWKKKKSIILSYRIVFSEGRPFDVTTRQGGGTLPENRVPIWRRICFSHGTRLSLNALQTPFLLSHIVPPPMSLSWPLRQASLWIAVHYYS